MVRAKALGAKESTVQLRERVSFAETGEGETGAGVSFNTTCGCNLT